MKCFSLTFVLLSFLFIERTQSQNITIWTGERSGDLICELEYFAVNANEAYSENICLQAFIDKWSRAEISLDGCSHYRKSIQNTQFLNFQIKSSNPEELVYLELYAWHAADNSESPSVNVANFISSGSLSEEYQLVSIPLDSLRNDRFTASWIEKISFYGDSPESMFNVYIDDIELIDTSKAKVSSVLPLSSNVLFLEYDGRYDLDWAQDTSNFYINSASDPDFQAPVYPRRAGIQYVYDGLVNDTLWLALPQSKYWAYLEFDKDLKDIATYALQVSYSDTSMNAEAHLFDYKESSINGSVKVNQIGYLPISTKYAYVGNYLGSLGPMKIEANEFLLIRSSDDEVRFTGALDFRGVDPLLSGENVYECNFSEFGEEGEYYILVPGIGRSHDFVIGNDVYDEALKTAARGLFLQRCGMDLQLEHAGEYAHEACHLSEAKVHYSIANIATYGNELINSKVEVSGGWHDAGDYSRPLSNQIIVISDLLTAYEMFPHKFGDDWGISESGNGISDILDEAVWGIKYLLKMQSEDGGVFFKVATKDYPAVLPEEDTNQYYVSAKTTHVTAMYAAVLAHASRVIKECFPELSDSSLVHAQKAWNFLADHDEAVPDFGYVDELLDSDLTCGETPDDGDNDERAWAAIELYKATLDASFHEAFHYYWTMNEPFFGWSRQAHSQKRASRSYLELEDLAHDNSIKELILASMKADANELAELTNKNLYRGAYRSDHRPYIGWGNYSQSSNQAATLIKAFHKTNDARYLNAASLNMDPQFGNNPLSICFVTGLGDHSVTNPIHYPSQLDGVDTPVPGIPVYGVHHNEEWQYKDFISSDVTYPPFYNVLTEESEFPTLRRYFDQQRVFSMNEFTIAENMSHLIFTLAYFSDNNVDVGCNISDVLEIAQTPSVQISPNPAMSVIKVSSEESYNQAVIFDVNGKMVYSSSYYADELIDVSNMTNGLYILKLIGKAGYSTFKFIKM